MLSVMCMFAFLNEMRQFSQSQINFAYKSPKKLQLPGFANTYLFERQSNASVGLIDKRSGGPLRDRLHHDRSVRWADEQVPLIRSKRDLQFSEEYAWQTFDVPADQYELQRTGVEQEPARPIFNDELWSQQWYVHDTRTRAGLPKLDLNVLPVWQRGITGAGIRVAVLDDGLEHGHDDLRQNYVSLMAHYLTYNI